MLGKAKVKGVKRLHLLLSANRYLFRPVISALPTLCFRLTWPDSIRAWVSRSISLSLYFISILGLCFVSALVKAVHVFEALTGGRWVGLQ